VGAANIVGVEDQDSVVVSEAEAFSEIHSVGILHII
jgi:hypothetical protein